MFIYLPDQSVMFVGDFIMPYLGHPLRRRAIFRDYSMRLTLLLKSIPSTCCTATSPSPVISLPPPCWCSSKPTGVAARTGTDRGPPRRRTRRDSPANLIPPGLLGGQPDVYQPYLILREHVIDRLYDQNVGYWQPDLEGLDHLGRADRAELWSTTSVYRKSSSLRPWSARRRRQVRTGRLSA